MCRTSEIDGRCVHLRGSDRCEISYAVIFIWSMCRSTFEDPIDVNFIIIVVTVVVPRVCVCVPVRSFYRHVHLDPEILVS